MPRANKVHTTPGADRALVAACEEFLAAAAELTEFSHAGQGDNTAVTQRYCRALTDLTQAIPQSRGAFTARAIAAHMATRTARRVLPREARIAVTGLMSAAARS